MPRHTVTQVPVLHVRITDDRDLVIAFLQWQGTTLTFPKRRTPSSSGLGGYSAFFDMKDKPAINWFFREYEKARK